MAVNIKTKNKQDGHRSVTLSFLLYVLSVFFFFFLNFMQCSSVKIAMVTSGGIKK